MNALLQGFLVSGGLIVAIGAQNAFVLKQGLKRWRVLPIVLTCFLCDFLLMTLGVFGLGTLIGESRVASVALAFIGALFLAVYGARAFRSAWRGGAVMELGRSRPRRCGFSDWALARVCCCRCFASR